MKLKIIAGILASLLSSQFARTTDNKKEEEKFIDCSQTEGFLVFWEELLDHWKMLKKPTQDLSVFMSHLEQKFKQDLLEEASEQEKEKTKAILNCLEKAQEYQKLYKKIKENRKMTSVKQPAHLKKMTKEDLTPRRQQSS
jgi:hypothetical protein